MDSILICLNYIILVLKVSVIASYESEYRRTVREKHQQMWYLPQQLQQEGQHSSDHLFKPPLHLQRNGLSEKRHLVDATMAGHAAHALGDMDAVIEVDEIG